MRIIKAHAPTVEEYKAGETDGPLYDKATQIYPAEALPTYPIADPEYQRLVNYNWVMAKTAELVRKKQLRHHDDYIDLLFKADMLYRLAYRHLTGRDPALPDLKAGAFQRRNDQVDPWGRPASGGGSVTTSVTKPDSPTQGPPPQRRGVAASGPPPANRRPPPVPNGMAKGTKQLAVGQSLYYEDGRGHFFKATIMSIVDDPEYPYEIEIVDPEWKRPENRFCVNANHLELKKTY